MSSIDMYEEVNAHSEVMTASSHRLIQLLFDKCLEQLNYAEGKQLSDERAYAIALGRAIEIVAYLRACLRYEDEQTANLAHHLETLYAYSHRALVQISLKPNEQLLNEVKTVLRNIKEGWDGIADKVQ